MYFILSHLIITILFCADTLGSYETQVVLKNTVYSITSLGFEVPQGFSVLSLVPPCSFPFPSCNFSRTHYPFLLVPLIFFKPSDLLPRILRHWNVTIPIFALHLPSAVSIFQNSNLIISFLCFEITCWCFGSKIRSWSVHNVTPSRLPARYPALYLLCPLWLKLLPPHPHTSSWEA